MVTVEVASDLLPDRSVTITKNPTELPSKFYVDYLSAVKDALPGAQKDPTSAVRYETVDDWKKKNNPKTVNLVDPVQQSGFTASAPQNQVLFFYVETRGG
jgi:hypothetical protein